MAAGIKVNAEKVLRAIDASIASRTLDDLCSSCVVLSLRCLAWVKRSPKILASAYTKQVCIGLDNYRIVLYALKPVRNNREIKFYYILELLAV